MEVKANETIGGSLQISVEAISKIARLATLEVDGVKAVASGNTGVKGFFNKKVSIDKPITVEFFDGVAEVTVKLIACYGVKVPTMSEAVQNNVKNAIQGMTSVTVSRVNVVITGVAVEMQATEVE